MRNEKKNYFLSILILFIIITFIPVLTYLLTKNENVFSLSLIPIVLIALFIFKISIIYKINKNNFFWGIISIFYPLIVIFIICFFIYFFNRDANINIFYLKTSGFFINLLIIFIVLFFTEEALFRGIFWFLFDKIELSLLNKIFFISILFALWHIPVIILFPDFRLKAFVIPIYFLNIFLFSFNIGMLRYFSNSIIFISFCHALWNTLIYTFFGSGKEIGSWGIKNYFLFDPERGLMGIALQGLIILFFLYSINIKKQVQVL